MSKDANINAKTQEVRVGLFDMMEGLKRPYIFILGNERTLKGAMKGLREDTNELSIILMNFVLCIMPLMEDNQFVIVKEDNSMYSNILKNYKEGKYKCLKI